MNYIEIEKDSGYLRLLGTRVTKLTPKIKVYLNTTTCFFQLTAKSCRRLAKALTQAADEMEKRK